MLVVKLTKYKKYKLKKYNINININKKYTKGPVSARALPYLTDRSAAALWTDGPGGVCLTCANDSIPSSYINP